MKFATPKWVICGWLLLFVAGATMHWQQTCRIRKLELLVMRGLTDQDERILEQFRICNYVMEKVTERPTPEDMKLAGEREHARIKDVRSKLSAETQ